MRTKHPMYFTSVLHDYTTLPRPNKSPWFSPNYFTIDEAIAISLAAGLLEFASGTKWEYSNVDFMLLAKIAERVSGMPLADFLQQRVFGPLGMPHTSLNDDATLVIPHRATGYALRSDSGLRAALASVGVNVRPGPGHTRVVRNSPHYGGRALTDSIGFSNLAIPATWACAWRLGAGSWRLATSTLRGPTSSNATIG